MSSQSKVTIDDSYRLVDLKTLPAGGEAFDLYVPDHSLVIFDGVFNSNKDCSRLVKLINDNSAQQVIFDVSINATEIEPLLEHLDTFTFNKSVQVWTCLLSYYRKENVDPRVRFVPMLALWSSHQSTEYNSQSDRPYKLSCLNANAWKHRILTYIKLAEKSYFKDIIFTWGRSSFGLPTVDDNINNVVITDEEMTAYANLPKSITWVEKDSASINDLTVEHPAYTDAYINLVTESCSRVLTPGLTEKIFKPILAGQLFLLVGSPGCIRFLRDVGIDTFDDIINHSYDNTLDDRTRILEVIAEVDRLMTQDLKSIFESLGPRLKRNSDYLKSQEFRNNFLPI